MSLELALKENTDTMKQLIAVWNTLTTNATVMAATLQPGDTIAAGGVAVAKVSAPKQTAATVTAPEKTAAAAAGQSADPKPAAVSPQPETAAASPASKPEASSPAPSTVTYDDVKALVLQVSKDKGRDAAAAVLAGFGVAKAPELKPEQYADAVAQFKAALA